MPWLKTIPSAKHLGVSPRKFREWVARGLIRRAVVDGVCYFEEGDLDEFMRSRMVYGKTGKGGEIDRLVNEITTGNG